MPRGLALKEVRSPESGVRRSARSAGLRTPDSGLALAVTHGGVGAPTDHSDGCAAAAAATLGALARRRSALDAVVAGAVLLEDDPRFNAGTGSHLRLDGRTVQMDAAVMDSSGRLGAVAAIEFVKNPILVARAVVETPHVLLCADGAIAFARARGFPRYRVVTAGMRARWQKVVDAINSGRKKSLPTSWRRFNIPESWNFRRKIADVLGCDTIGVVVRDARGNFAVANSTGGSSPMLRGRIGDSPIAGAGYWAGPAGAVAATGQGEEMIRRLLCKTVYDWIAAGASAQAACARGVALIPADIHVGLIAVSATGHGAADNRQMPWAAADSSGRTWGP